MARKILSILLGIVTVTVLTFLTLFVALYAKPLKEVVNDFTLRWFVIIFLIVIGSLFIFIFRKKKTYAITLAVSISGLILFILTKPLREELPKPSFVNHTIQWVSETKKTTIPFHTAASGLIYFKATVDGQVGYLLFDTGNSSTGLHEKFDIGNIPDGRTQFSTDAAGITVERKVSTLGKLSIGDVNITEMDYWLMKKDNLEEFEKSIEPDSVIGVLGIEIISDFAWDINMTKETITISENSPVVTEEPSQKLSINESNKKWELDISVNGMHRSPKIDFGFNRILMIKDTVPKAKGYLYPVLITEQGETFFSSRKDEEKDMKRSVVFATLKVGKDTFENVQVFQGNNVELLGISFFRSYERVILDFKKEKVLLFNPTVDSPFHPDSISHAARMNTYEGLIKRSSYFDWYIHQPNQLVYVNRKGEKKTRMIQGKLRLYGYINEVHKINYTRMILLDNGNLDKAYTENDIVVIDLDKNTYNNIEDLI